METIALNSENQFVNNIQELHRKNRFEMIPVGNFDFADTLRLNCHSIIRNLRDGHLILSFYDDEENKVYKALDAWTNNKELKFNIVGFNGEHAVARQITITAKTSLVSWSTYTDFSWNDPGPAPSIDLEIRSYEKVHVRF